MPKGIYPRKNKKVKKLCQICKKEFWANPCYIKIGKEKFCSQICYYKSRKGRRISPATEFKKGMKKMFTMYIFPKGKNHPMWKGGRSKAPAGYISILNPNHPLCDKNRRVREHRLIMEQKLGRYLTPEEAVHHINGNVADNRIENLQLFTDNSSHSKFHLNILLPKSVWKKGHIPWNKGKKFSKEI